MSEEERIAAFEPVRAIVRPKKCDGSAGCWVKTGPRGYVSDGRCGACRGYIVFAGNEAKHQAALRRALVALNQPAP